MTSTGEIRLCSRCGSSFTATPTGGRPRTRCNACRSTHAQLDGTAWRKLRLQVLEDEPTCRVRGCWRPSTHVDHIVPLSRGGAPLSRDNLQGLCAHHNTSKGAKMPLFLPDAPAPEVLRTWRGCIGECPDTCPGGLGRWHI